MQGYILNDRTSLWYDNLLLLNTGVDRIVWNAEGKALVHVKARSTDDANTLRTLPDLSTLELLYKENGKGRRDVRDGKLLLRFNHCKRLRFFGETLIATEASQAGLVTFTLVLNCDVDWFIE
jgi:arginine/lysine/ornithine decarboxylase